MQIINNNSTFSYLFRLRTDKVWIRHRWHKILAPKLGSCLVTFKCLKLTNQLSNELSYNEMSCNEMSCNEMSVSQFEDCLEAKDSPHKSIVVDYLHRKNMYWVVQEKVYPAYFFNFCDFF